MKKVHFLTGKDQIPDYLTTPVYHNEKALCERGYRTSFSYKLSEKFLSCDILCLVSKPVIRMLNENQTVFKKDGPILSFIEKCRKYTNKIIWMDIADSTGVTHFELLPYVDLYLKKHLLKDKTLYQKEFYGGRIFTDFYHKKFGIIDSQRFNQFYPLDLKYIYKVGLSWNMGIGDMYNAFSKKNAIRRLFPSYIPASYEIPFTDPLKDRKYDIFLRTSSALARETVAFHRQELIKRLDEILQKNNSISGSVKGKISLKMFREMMGNSKIAFGPFGWGELNVKEYEALIFGAILVRPEISHMETWPEIFIENETYWPFSWGFDDLESVVLECLKDEQKRLRIARNGQEAYRDSISQAGMEKFCDWFIRQIEK